MAPHSWCSPTRDRAATGVNTAATLALIREAYPDLAKRARAVAVWAMGGAAAAAAINDEEAGES